MTVIEMKLADITPYEKNPRKNDGAVDAVANSIKEFGFKVPIVVDSENVIVCGHTRYKAAQQLGLESVPCVVADDLTEEQIKAFRLADNKVGELADWDFELLDMELEGLDFDMSLFGFKDAEDIDWAGVEDLDEDTYEEPEKTMLKCPCCGHIDSKTHFLKVNAVDVPAPTPEEDGGDEE